MNDTLMGRTTGILIAEGSGARLIKKIQKTATGADAAVKVVAPKIGGVVPADGSFQPADGELAGMPSVQP